MIVIPQSVLEKIPDSDDRQIAFINDKIAEKEHVLEAMQEAGIDDKIMQCRAEKELEDLQAEKAAVVEVSKKKRDEKKAAVFLKIRPLQQSQSLQNIQAHLGEESTMPVLHTIYFLFRVMMQRYYYFLSICIVCQRYWVSSVPVHKVCRVRRKSQVGRFRAF